MILKFLNISIMILVAVVLCVNPVFAATDMSIYYNNAANWIGNTLVVTDNLQLSGNFTIPDDKTLKIYNGYQITVPAGYALTINGGIEAGSYPIFIDQNPLGGTLGIAGNPKVEFINPNWWGLRSGTGEAQWIKLQRAINLAAQDVSGSSGGIVRIPYAKSDILIDNTIIVKRGVILDCQWSIFTVTADMDVFYVQERAQLKNLVIGHVAISPNYTKTFVTLKPTQHISGDTGGLWLSGLKAAFRANTGNAVCYDASSSYYIEHTIANDIVCTSGNVCLLLKAGGSFGSPSIATWVSGNLITNVSAQFCEYAIYETFTDNVGGNSYVNLMTQPDRSGPMKATVLLNDASIVSGGGFWDWTPVVLKGDGNIVMTYGSKNAPLTDEGNNNRIIFSGAQYFDGLWLNE